MSSKLKKENDRYRARVVILGASNLTRGFSTVVETCRMMLGSPLAIIAALGHGRSYGIDSSVFVRTLPGILPCGLWDALEESMRQRPDLPTFALITDIGNDIMYGQTAETLIEWVSACIDRLQGIGARVAMSKLPIDGLRAVSPRQYAIVRAILFPTRHLTLKDAIDRANAVHDGLLRIAETRGVRLIDPASEWYGFDPIHIKRRHIAHAWRAILTKTFELETGHSAYSVRRISLETRLKLLRAFPDRWRLLGWDRHTAQPTARLSDGTEVGLF